jgi:hypothetical protein
MTGPPGVGAWWAAFYICDGDRDSIKKYVTAEFDYATTGFTLRC